MERDARADQRNQQHFESGSASNVVGHGNVTQTVRVESAKPSKLTAVLVPITAALISALVGAYATHKFTLMRAPEITANGTETLLGIAKGAIDLAQANKASPELIQKLEALASQAQAVQASAQALQQPAGAASLQADFWLSLGQGAQLPKGGTIGINQVNGPGDVVISFNDTVARVSSGRKLQYKPKDGTSCFAVYLGASPNTKLHGFKTWCES